MGSNSSRSNRIDRIDLSILAALYTQARVSKVQMSTEVGLSANRCNERMRRLEEAAIIRGYHANIDITRLTSCMQFMVQVKLFNYSVARGRQFERSVLKIGEIISCQAVLGTIDYVLVIIAAGVESYQDVISELRESSECEFDFVTFPVSKAIKSAGEGDLRQLVSKLTREKIETR